MQVERPQKVSSAEEVWIGVAPCAAGWAGLVGRGAVVTGISLLGEGDAEEVLAAFHRRHPAAVVRGRGFGKASSALRSWMAGGDGGRLRLRVEGTAFQRAVWAWMVRIPRGKTASYGAIARWMGRPGSARAVGRASASNPLPLAIPCHRVVGADGLLTGFSAPGGLAWKRSLLDREGVRFLPGRPSRVAETHRLTEPPPACGPLLEP